jgi:hypothetical protein
MRTNKTEALFFVPFCFFSTTADNKTRKMLKTTQKQTEDFCAATKNTTTKRHQPQLFLWQEKDEKEQNNGIL